jgi:hypothetical protein
MGIGRARRRRHVGIRGSPLPLELFSGPSAFQFSVLRTLDPTAPAATSYTGCAEAEAGKGSYGEC